MKRILSLLLALALAIGCGAFSPYASAAQSGLTFALRTAVFSISEERFLRWVEEPASQGDCGPDEYVTVQVEIQNTGTSAVVFENPYITIDGGDPLRWTELTVDAGKTIYPHVYHSNAPYLTPGLHTAVFYNGEQALYTGRFSIGRDWSEIMQFPTQAQIDARPDDYRSPYLSAWLSAPDALYDMYSVDFKSDHIPCGTYSCLFNGYLDFSSPKNPYVSAANKGHISLYAGVQRGEKGTNSILSLWDIYCEDGAGNVTVIRPTQIYPAGKNESFGNEGEGSHDLSPYDWQPGRWYRMLLRLGTSDLTGNTTVEQWLLDLTTNQWTHTSTFDIGLKDVRLKGSMAFFSENFNPKYAGEVRTLELTNVRIHTAEGWQNVENCGRVNSSHHAASLENANGSWEAGADEHTIYVISTGVSGWGRTEATEALTIQNRETGDPLAENPPKETMRFTDVASNAYYHDAVQWAILYGITSGTTDTTFSPDIPCTHGQILTFLWLSKGRPAPAGTVSGTEYYANAVQWAKEHGLTDGSLNPDAVCTRADLVTYLWKLAGSPRTGSAAFSDVPANASFAAAVTWAVQAGITSGTSDTTFSPDLSCTRGQIVTFLYKAIAKGPLGAGRE